ncbi:testis-expressed protein 49-like [Huso huso]|uniref:Testis-expressed protein 49-like n=1 Tax=Huso huso TaxID=61971 RepID=A0ABR0Y2M8_HUSHU
MAFFGITCLGYQEPFKSRTLQSWGGVSYRGDEQKGRFRFQTASDPQDKQHSTAQRKPGTTQGDDQTSPDAKLSQSDLSSAPDQRPAVRLVDAQSKPDCHREDRALDADHPAAQAKQRDDQVCGPNDIDEPRLQLILNSL